MRQLRGAGASKLTMVVLVVCAALAGGGPGAAAKGVKYAPAGGGFSVMFPAAPEKHSNRQDFGAFVFQVNVYGLSHGGMTYMVTSFGDIPAEATDDPLLEQVFLSRVEEGFTLAAQRAGKPAAVVSRSNISLDGFNGRQLVMDLAPGMGVMRAYKAGPRFYTVGVFGNKDDFSADRAVAFLDSFKFTAKKQ